MGLVNVWFLTMRPKTLFTSISPVLIGSVIAADEGLFAWPLFCFILLTSLLIQIGTNFANDYFDVLQGSDTAERLGPKRGVHLGVISLSSMRRAFLGTFAAAILSSLYLIRVGGWPIACLALLAPFLGIAYTAGRYALASLGLGDLFVFVFFGPVAAASTFFLHTMEWAWVPCIAGFAPGFFAMALLSCANLRDREEDLSSGKKTLPVRLGKRAGLWEYSLCIILPSLIPILLLLITHHHRYALFATSCFFPAIALVSAVRRAYSYEDHLLLLSKTAQLHLLYTLFFCLGWRL